MRYTYGLRGRQIDVTLLSGLELQEPTVHNQRIYYRHLCTFAFGKAHTRLRPPTSLPPNVSIIARSTPESGHFQLKSHQNSVLVWKSLVWLTND